MSEPTIFIEEPEKPFNVKERIEELERRVKGLEWLARGDGEPIDPEEYEKVLKLLERMILAYEQPDSYSELLVDLIQEAKYRTKQARQDREGPR